VTGHVEKRANAGQESAEGVVVAQAAKAQTEGSGK
jgi:hypothetical protein